MKRFFGLFLALVITTTAYAAVKSPVDIRGFSVGSIDWVGATSCVINASTGTNAVECTPQVSITAGQTPPYSTATVRGMVYGVMVTSDAASTTLVFRDTNTANTTSSSFTAVTPPFITTGLYGGIITFPRPIQFTNGLSLNLSATATAGSVWTILWRPMAATE